MKKYLKKITEKTKREYLEELNEKLHNNTKSFIITVNPETLMLSKKNIDIKNILEDKNNSLVPDGIAVVKACQKIGMNVQERITGIDLCEYLLCLANEKNYSLALFGATKEVLEKLILKIKKEYPNIKLLECSNGYIENKEQEMKKIIELNPDICLVALGIPEQEILISKYIEDAKKGIYIGVGGSLDVLSGTKKRAPEIFIKLNLEWLYRIIKEPKRIKRFWNNNIKFLIEVRKNK